MYIADIGAEFFVPFLVFAIPIIAIVGGITAGIVRTLGRQRLIELAQRERIAAIERGVDPSKLPPLPRPTSTTSAECTCLPTNTRGAAPEPDDRRHRRPWRSAFGASS